MSRARQNSRAAQRAAPPATPSPVPPGAGHLVAELREEVKRVVLATTASSYPAVRARLGAGLAGYQQVESDVIHVALHNNITPGAALALLESEWGDVA